MPNVARPQAARRSVAARKVRRLSRVVLRRLIAQKVQTLGDADLRRLAAELRITVPDGTALPTELETAKAMHRERGTRAQRLALSTDDHGGVRELSGSGVGQTIGLEEGRAGLDALTIEDTSSDWASSELLGAGETAARLEVARATLDNWRNAGKVVAFRKGVRNYVYPIRQFERFGPIEGLDRVLAQFPT